MNNVSSPVIRQYIKATAIVVLTVLVYLTFVTLITLGTIDMNSDTAWQSEIKSQGLIFTFPLISLTTVTFLCQPVLFFAYKLHNTAAGHFDFNTAFTDRILVASGSVPFCFGFIGYYTLPLYNWEQQPQTFALTFLASCYLLSQLLISMAHLMLAASISFLVCLVIIINVRIASTLVWNKVTFAFHRWLMDWQIAKYKQSPVAL